MRSGDMNDWQNGFINSNSGHFILAQALVIAIKELDKVEGAMKEVSNISDMQYLLDNYFDVYQQVCKMDMDARTRMATGLLEREVKTSIAERQIELGRD